MAPALSLVLSATSRAEPGKDQEGVAEMVCLRPCGGSECCGSFIRTSFRDPIVSACNFAETKHKADHGNEMLLSRLGCYRRVLLRTAMADLMGFRRAFLAPGFRRIRDTPETGRSHGQRPRADCDRSICRQAAVPDFRCRPTRRIACCAPQQPKRTRFRS
jgi:hypothetical protein